MHFLRSTIDFKERQAPNTPAPRQTLAPIEISLGISPYALSGGSTNSEAALPNLVFRMPDKPALPLNAISRAEPYAIYSQTKGLISGHDTVTEVAKAFTRHAINNPDTDALIYSREVYD